MNVNIKVHNVKSIKEADIDLPLEKGMYAIVGENGCGKSTLMLVMSFMVKTSSNRMLTSADIDTTSTVDITTDDAHDHWYVSRGRLTTGHYEKQIGYDHGFHDKMVVDTHWPGFYEGSIFYGSRFDDFDAVGRFFSNPDYRNDIARADTFVSETLSYILHNDKEHYKNLYHIKNKVTAKSHGFKGMPYFVDYNGTLVSQFRMSSGECLLISLIDFINNLVIKGTNFHKFLFLIDEVELALHPGAIDRLLLFLDNLVKNTNSSDLVIYFSTHSSELIQRLSHRNIFLLENEAGVLDVTNPCYPNYAIRSLYIPNGYDFILLVEDELAKSIVSKVIRTNNLSQSKLCCVLPAGGWIQMLKLHHDMVTYNTLGAGKKIISIYDGDVQKDVMKKTEYASFPKLFLPIPSVEKYLKKKLVDDPDKAFRKLIGDKYFTQRSLTDIVNDYLSDPRTKQVKDNAGKNFYSIIISNALKNGITEIDFIKYLADDIYDYEKPTTFVTALTKMLT